MPLLLHLTDLHLSTQPHVDAFDDYSKSEIIPPAERQGRTTLIRNTLVELDALLRKNGTKLDAVAVTGDITYQNQEDGFAALDGVLAGLGESRPANNRIAIVPGNHDVAWKTPPSGLPRYERFRHATYEAGFITPLLDGLDFNAEGTLEPHVDVSRHLIDDPVAGWTIVPLNSSNYCGSVDGFADKKDRRRWEKIPTLFKSAADRAAVEKMLLQSRLHDVARFSPGQFTAVRNVIKNLAPSVRIALLHHHLLPVSEREEAKAYESILNLGLLRAMLSSNQFHVVLHGHKHESATYFDEVQRTGEAPHRMLVISGATLGGVPPEGEVGRLLAVNTSPYTPSLAWQSVPAMRPGTTKTLPDPKTERLWSVARDAGGSSVKIVNGTTVNEVYSQLTEICETAGLDKPVFYVVAHIEDPKNADLLPDRYPNDFPIGRDAAERQEQFKAIVDWWQRETSEIDNQRVFTHGARLFANKKRLVNSLKLQDKARAVATLLRPGDDIDNEYAKFPSFCLAQFFVVDQRLACIGYFRKQELRYWWPVNVAELARAQMKLIRDLRSTFGVLEPGPITTFAAVAVGAKSPPRVAIPLIDRLIDMDKELLWRMTYALVRTDAGRKNETAVFWTGVLDDLLPSLEPAPDGTPVSMAGVAYVRTQLKRFASVHQEVRELSRLFEDLFKLNDGNEDIAVGKNDGYVEWRDRSIDLITNIRSLIRQRLTSSS
jgi:3',5'-cyclic AMP phosphodiesterase CpdA